MNYRVNIKIYLYSNMLVFLMSHCVIVCPTNMKLLLPVETNP